MTVLFYFDNINNNIRFYKIKKLKCTFLLLKVVEYSEDTYWNSE